MIEMKKSSLRILLLLVMVGSFLAGSWSSQRRSRHEDTRARSPQGPLLRGPHAPGLQVRQAGHRTGLRHGAGAGLRRTAAWAGPVAAVGDASRHGERQPREAAADRRQGGDGGEGPRDPHPPGAGEGRPRRDPDLPDQCRHRRLGQEDSSRHHRQPGQEGRAAGHLLCAGVLLGDAGLSLWPAIAGPVPGERQGDQRAARADRCQHRELPERPPQPGDDRAPDGGDHAHPAERGEHRDPGAGGGLHPRPEHLTRASASRRGPSSTGSPTSRRSGSWRTSSRPRPPSFKPGMPVRVSAPAPEEDVSRPG